MRGSTLSCLLVVALLCGWRGAPSASERELRCPAVESAPTVDGGAADAGWAAAPRLVTHDPLAEIDIELSCVHTDAELFFLVRYPDASENRAHKLLHWDATASRYRSGPEREDTLVLKWSMEPFPVDLTLAAEESYRADVWFWKSVRTDPVGYADDKLQSYSKMSPEGSRQMISKEGRVFHLVRRGDDGTSAYRSLAPDSYLGETTPAYANQDPAGSRGDIRARGVWKDGAWTIELRRALETGHPDDVQFAPGLRFQFGVSRFEIAGRSQDPTLDEPRFGSGEISEPLWLRIE